MLLLYNLFIVLYRAAIGVAALWQPKAEAWVQGHRGLWKKLEQNITKGDNWIWVHSASAGEFEQAKPVIEALKEKFPGNKIICSFFSPSGYAAGKKFKSADAICYLPLDTANNASRFVSIVNPSLVLFIKYEWWYHHLKAVKQQDIPILMVSALFRESSIFFKSYGFFYRRMLALVRHLFVQDEASLQRLHSIGVQHVSVSGDTRFDRVLKLASEKKPESFFTNFCAASPVIVAGSTWPDDETLLITAAKKDAFDCRWIIAPHEISTQKIKALQQLWPAEIALYSEEKDAATITKKILVIDNVGMLSGLYQYATVTYIGGGFNKSGIHNTLEAAVWGKPVLFGPNYQKFKEAVDLITYGAAAPIEDQQSLETALNALLHNKIALAKKSNAAVSYVQQNSGATQKIIAYIEANRLLTIA